MKTSAKSAMLFAMMLSTFVLNAQTWMKNVNKENPNFYEIQKAFYDYNKDIKEKSETSEEQDGYYEQFKRWEWYWEQRVGKNGTFPPSDILWTELRKYSESHSTPMMQRTTETADWTFMGPSSSIGGYRGIGRINCIAFHPTLANTFWVGTPAGGLWKTTDNGTTWTTNTDDLPVLGISDIAINSSNPSTMYIATGDGDAALSLQNGAGDTKSVGVLKTTNGGATWNTTGLNWDATDQKLIRRLLINPDNASILLAATSDGIYRTTNAGTSWTLEVSGWFIDMEFKTTDPDYVYATTYDPFGNDAQIFTSTDNGISWTQVTNFTDYNRINLAVSPDWDNEVDALCSNTLNGLGGLWYSANSGASFTQYFNADCTNNLLNSAYDASGCDGQGFYDLAYNMNPSDANEIWIGGVNTWRSTDGGSSWYLNNFWNSSYPYVPEVHADKHFIVFHPLNNDYVFECNDGGLYETNDGGTTWYDITNGMGISEIYRIGTSATIENLVICGLQDNGTKELYAGDWYEIIGGDGTECIIDYTDENIQYAAYVEGVIYKTSDAWSNGSEIVSSGGTGVDEEGEWVTPYIIHPTNHNTLLVGKSQVYCSTNGGTSWSQLGTISGASGNIIALAYAPSNTSTIYAATQHEFYRTTNGGSTWDEVGTSTDAITYIAVSSTNSQKIWVTNSGYTDGEKVYSSTDGGSTWSNFSGTLPNIPVNCIVYQDGSNDALYTGTDLGVYYRDGSMTDWVTYNTGLPNVIVNELEISYINNKLWAATFGRGLWISDLYTAVGVTENKKDNSFSVYPNPTNDFLNVKSKYPDNDNYKMVLTNTLGQMLFESELKSARNSIEIQIDLKEFSSGIYCLSITSGKGKQVFKVQKN